MKQLLVFLSFLCLFFIACNQKKDQKSCLKEVNTPPPIDEDVLIFRLSSDLIATPVSKPQQDQNAIVNYSIDHLLDVKPTRSGLYYQILEEGAGDLIKWGEQISVHYRGFLLNGEEFDSSCKKINRLSFM